MTPNTVITRLANHGCIDVTDTFDWSLPFRDARLGTGGFGDVYRGSLINGPRVAVKYSRVNRSHVEEGKVAKRLGRELYNEFKCEHENIMRPIGFIRDQDLIALVHPWMENGTLRECIKKTPDVNRYRLCTQVAKAVTYLHSIGTVHGDIKGPNIIISSDGIAKLGDFGNARSNSHSLKFTETTDGIELPTRWAAPELFEEIASYSKEVDVYALAMTILEAITGEVSYAHVKGNLAIMNKVHAKKETPLRPAVIPTDRTYGDLLWGLLIDCWAYEASLRSTAPYVAESMLIIEIEHSSTLADSPT